MGLYSSNVAGGNWSLVKTIDINTLITGTDTKISAIPYKEFTHSGSNNNLDMSDYQEMGVYIQWYVNGAWSAWGNFVTAPLSLINNMGEGYFNECVGFAAENTTAIYWSQWPGKEPFIWGGFFSTANSSNVTKARIKIYGKK